MWTVERVLKVYSKLPFIEDEDEWRKAYVVPIEQFDIPVNQTPSISDPYSWDFSEAEAVTIPLSLIRTSWQSDGVRLDALCWYIQNDELFDREGWFDNDKPVLISRPDGTYTVRDGNHRVIAAKLRRDDTIKAYVVE